LDSAKLHARDGKTPEERTKQILQIATILPGQKPDRRFSIPSRRSTASITQVESHKSTNALLPATANNEEQSNALIDTTEARKGQIGAGVEANQLDKLTSVVRRQDSETNDVDVFLDADS